MSEFNINALENCIRVIGYWMNEDETVMKELIKTRPRFVEMYVKPFSKELNLNLIHKESEQGKIDIIRYYLFEFKNLIGFFQTNEDTLYKISKKDSSKIFKDISEVKTGYEKYTILSNILFDFIMYEIQSCCIKYEIDFFNICHRLDFSLEYNDSGLTIAFKEAMEEKENTNTKLKNKKPRTLRNDEPNYFKDIFIEKDYKKYVLALAKTDPPILTNTFEFIGKVNNHKGVVCEWFIELQNRGKIKSIINRSQLAKVLNNELKGFNLGQSGRSFGNISTPYRLKFKKQLESNIVKP